MGLLTTLDRVGRFQPGPFTAPVWNPHMKILSVQDGIPNWFYVDAPSPGWWNVTPNRKLERGWSTQTLSPAMPWQIYAFLESLPRFLVITLFRVRENVWMCIPFNASDAAQRYWPNSSPREIYLVNENISQLMCVSVRLFADTLLYEGVSARVLASDGTGYGIAQDIMERRQAELERRRREVEKLAREQELANSLEARIDQHLDFMGASMVQWEERGEAVEVTWEYEGYTHTSRIDRDASVLSAGICLEGTDREHNLSTLVATIQEARELHRFDMPRESYV